MTLTISTSESGTKFELHEGVRVIYTSRLLSRGRLLAVLAGRLSPRVRGRIFRIVLSYEGGSFSEMRSAAAIGNTIGFAFGVPVYGHAGARSGGRGALPAYAAPPSITASVAHPGPFKKGRPAARSRYSVQNTR